jgi:ubiquinone/menaquinone biosynthesis C-methylase UbiE
VCCLIKPSPGYKPDPVWWKDQIHQIIGAPMLLKRLQMPAIFQALAIKPGMKALDIGCGSGYMTYQMAYDGAIAYGIDIIKMDDFYIPENLRGKLTFIKTEGETIPFEENFFDIILVSEVITQVPEPQKMLTEIKRILKPGGRVVIIQPLDRQGIREDYENNSIFIRFMRMIWTIPKDYNDYLARIQRVFGNIFPYLPPEEYYHRVLSEHGFLVVDTKFSPSGPAIKLYERIQFFCLCFGWPTYGKRYFLMYPFFKIVDAWHHNKPGPWCIFISRLKNQSAVK